MSQAYENTTPCKKRSKVSCDIDDLLDNTPWRFMRPEIVEGRTIVVETDDGTDFLPASVVNVVLSESYTDDPKVLRRVRPFVRGEPREVSVQEHSYLCRMSADGFMDCTDWEPCDTLQEVLEWVENEASECVDASVEREPTFDDINP